jgi:DNA (cytosine-5)-methyltransferase 1
VRDTNFDFVDLFAGIGGFHAVLSHAGGRCVFASEIDPKAKAVYERNWLAGTEVAGDITQIPATDVPVHDVLTAGFPCQAFSKSGLQRGLNEARGTLFFDILRILEHRKPAMIMLENVRNLSGPRHVDTWSTIVRLLREVGYRLPSEPAIFSPHLLPPEVGGTPQWRERVYIVGTYVGPGAARREIRDEPVVSRFDDGLWDPQDWDLSRYLALVGGVAEPGRRLSDDETIWLDVWDEFVKRLTLRRGSRLPGFPMWLDSFRARPNLTPEMPEWKRKIVRSNSDFYVANRLEIDTWRARQAKSLRGFPASRRKLEWQAGRAPSLWDCAIQLRPSGIRAKRPNYLPALVAMNQTSVLGWSRRFLSVGEAAALQGMPEWFDFGRQADSSTFRQLGNGINVGAAWWVLRAHVDRYRHLLPANIVESILASAPPLPNIILRPKARPSAA